MSVFDAPAPAGGLLAAERQALDTLQSTLDAASGAFVDTYLSRRDQDTGTLADAETLIQTAAAAYEHTVNQALNQLNYHAALQSQLTTQLKARGWLSLGAWYHTFATANSKTNAVANASPITTGPGLQGEMGTGDLYHQVFAAYRAQVQNSPYTAPLGSQTAPDDGAALNATDPDAVFVSFFKNPMQKMTNWIATKKLLLMRIFQNR